MSEFYSTDAIDRIVSFDLIHRKNPNFKSAIKTLDALNLARILTADLWQSKALLWFLNDAKYFRTLDLTQDNIFGVLNALYQPHTDTYDSVLSQRLVEQALEKECIDDVFLLLQAQDKNAKINANILDSILRQCEDSHLSPNILEQLARAIQASLGLHKNDLRLKYLTILNQYSKQNSNAEEMQRNINILITKEDGEIDFDLLCFIWEKFHTREYSPIDKVLCNILRALPNIPDDINLVLCKNWISSAPYFMAFERYPAFYCSANALFSPYLLNSPMQVFLDIMASEDLSPKLLELARLDPELAKTLASKINKIEDPESLSLTLSQVKETYQGEKILAEIEKQKGASSAQMPSHTDNVHLFFAEQSGQKRSTEPMNHGGMASSF